MGRVILMLGSTGQSGPAGGRRGGLAPIPHTCVSGVASGEAEN